MPPPAPLSDAPAREPQLLRFGLRRLFLLVTLLSILCALLVGTAGVWPLVILFGVMLVAGHVGGNLIGTRLRDTSRDVIRWRSGQLGSESDRPVANVDPNVMATFELSPATPLADSTGNSRWTYYLVVTGAVVGASLGGSVLAATIGARITWPGLILGTVSCAVLGAWLAFLASSFTTIARHAWRHAHQGGK